MTAASRKLGARYPAPPPHCPRLPARIPPAPAAPSRGRVAGCLTRALTGAHVRALRAAGDRLVAPEATDAEVALAIELRDLCAAHADPAGLLLGCVRELLTDLDAGEALDRAVTWTAAREGVRVLWAEAAPLVAQVLGVCPDARFLARSPRVTYSDH